MNRNYGICTLTVGLNEKLSKLKLTITRRMQEGLQ